MNRILRLVFGICFGFLILNLGFFASASTIGARPIGMGGAFTGLADDTNAIFLNPAGIAGHLGERAAVSTRSLAGQQNVIMSGIGKVAQGNFGLSYVYNVANLSNTGTPGAIAKTIDHSVAFCFARSLNDFMVVPKNMGILSFGATIMLTSHKDINPIGTESLHEIRTATAIGVLAKPNDLFSVGLNYAGQGLSDTSFNVGASGKLFAKKLTWSLENTGYGVEYQALPMLALRAGHDGAFSTVGFGAKFGQFGVDYGYWAQATPIHYITFSIAVDEPEKKSS